MGPKVGWCDSPKVQVTLTKQQLSCSCVEPFFEALDLAAAAAA